MRELMATQPLIVALNEFRSLTDLEGRVIGQQGVVA
jgi:hypothetical protein